MKCKKCGHKENTVEDLICNKLLGNWRPTEDIEEWIALKKEPNPYDY